MPIIIGPSGYRILVISSSTVPLTLFLDNFLGSLHPRGLNLIPSKCKNSRLQQNENLHLATTAACIQQSGNASFIAAAVRKIVWDMSAGVRGSSRHTKFFTLAKFWMSDDREMTKGLLSNVETLRFTTVLDVRGAGHEERVAQTTCPHRIKKGRNFWRGEDFSKSSLSQQPSSAPFSAGILCSHPRSHPQAISHLAVVSGWWAAFSQPSNINLRWSWVGGRLFLNYWTSTSCRQLLVVIHERVPWKNPLTAFSGKKGECPEPNAVVSTSWAKTWKPFCSC